MQKQATKLTERLLRFNRELASLWEMRNLAGHDLEIHTPPGASANRAALLGDLAGRIQALLTGEELGELLEQAQGLELSPLAQSLLRENSRLRQQLQALPAEVYRDHTAICAEAGAAWRQYKYAEDYALFEPYLQRVIEITIQVADLWGWQGHRLNGLYRFDSPDISVAQLDALFATLRGRLLPLLERARAQGPGFDDGFLHQDFPLEAQQRLAHFLMAQIGFDFRRGLLTLGEHPCCYTINRNDVRISNHYYADDLAGAIFTPLHEGGHGLYEQNVAEELADTVLCGGIEDLHEASSRLWENLVGRSLPFWQWATPQLQAHFPGCFEDRGPDVFYRGFNRLTETQIRVHADEATYNLHIMLRYELEKEILGGNLRAGDLPEAWNEKAALYLGARPRTLAEGLLQDTHWPCGMFGYFQRYTLGNVFAAQIAQAAQKALPDYWQQIAAGQFAPLREWLTAHWYRYGKTQGALALLEQICGEGLNAEPLCDYLEEKYGAAK